MTIRGTYGGIFAEDFLSVPRNLETRTNRGFPHFHSDYGAGTRFDRKADPAKIAGPVRFLHRTVKAKCRGCAGHTCDKYDVLASEFRRRNANLIGVEATLVNLQRPDFGIQR